ncbi:MAG TPA: glutamate racemase, partial [Thermoanaerobaculia bacterium]|nr:glutamate racemase [Thermoanaerobaculia bacterium]
NIEFLTERGVKAVVIACNTASALALPELDPLVPTWGVIEPGAQKAVQVSRGKIGVIATEATVRSDAYPRALRRLRPDLEILSLACPLLVPLVEEGWHDDPVTEEVARRYLQPLLDSGIDTLVLGCTHYPLLKPVLQRIAGPGVVLVDSADTVAEVVAEGLAELGLEAGEQPAASHLCVTDAGEGFRRLASRILGDAELPLEWVDVV